MSKDKKQRYLYIDGQAVPVTEEVYRAYWHYTAKEDYFTRQLKTERFLADQDTQTAAFTPSREDSYERLLEQDEQFACESKPVEEQAVSSLWMEELFSTLSEEEQQIIYQRQMLERYARERGYNNTRFYIDDGVSGTTFQRSGFLQMISDIQSGQVRRVIVKDMSRFGRDYLQVGMYTEVLFLENDIHFIAVNDGVDSEKGENDFTLLRNLFNEWYARDTSKKIRAVFRAKGTSGKRLSSQPVYGYVADKNGGWQEDPETAPVVREIFALFLAGQGPAVIARMLTDRNVPTPGTIRYQRTGNLQGYCPEAPCKWVYQMVGCILARREYLGHTVNFKATKKSYKSKKVIHNSPEEQAVYENT